MKTIHLYLIYLIVTPIIGYTFMNTLTPLLKGAHDGGMIGMMLGILASHTFFSIKILRMRKITALISGIVYFIISIKITYLLNELIFFDNTQYFMEYRRFWMELTNFDPNNPYNNDRSLERIMSIAFFAIFLTISILIWILNNKLIERKGKDRLENNAT